jgi:hypothetical protein
VNSQEAAAATAAEGNPAVTAAFQLPSYTLYIEP